MIAQARSRRGRSLARRSFVAFCLIACAGIAGVTSELPAQKKGAAYKKELATLLSALDRDYPFFKLKGIRAAWKKTKRDAQKRVKKCKGDAAFFAIVLDVVRALRDGHASFPKVEIETGKAPSQFWTGLVLLPATEKRVVAIAVPKALDGVCEPGMVVTKIDGKSARAYLDARADAMWKAGGFFSSPQRARFFEYRVPLTSEKRGQKFKIEWLDGKKKRSRSIRADLTPKGWMHNYNMPSGLEQGARSVWHGSVADGKVGYVWFRRMDASAEEGFAKALEAHPDVGAWVVDLRGNTGGGYSKSFVARLPALAKGKRKVACLVDAGCISAGETFARDLYRHAKARVFGQTSAGSSSTKKVVDLLGGKLQVRYSVGTRSGIQKSIEFWGIEPHVPVEADPEEVRAGKNSTLERALEYLRK